MKISILPLLILLLLVGHSIQAQQVLDLKLKKATADSGGKKSDTSAKTTYDCSSIGKVNHLNIKKQENGSYLFALTDDNGNPVSSFTIFQFNIDLYKSKIIDGINKICNDTSNTARKEVLKKLEDQATYNQILEASLQVNDAAQIAGTLKIFKNINLYCSDKGQEAIKSKLKVYNIQLQFQDGFIENTIVEGKIAGQDSLLRFENFYPIAFSTKRNFQRLRRVLLYEKTIFIKAGYYIKVGELLDFKQQVHLNTKDYFPDNQTYATDITDSVKSVNLNRENTSKILAVQIFSDLKGASGDNPNGLIQIDFSKKLNMLTQRWPFPWSYSTNYGVLNYFIPEATLSKVENNQRHLILNYQGSSPTDPAKPNAYASTLDLLLYQQFSIGGKVNLLSLDVPSLKSTFFINSGFRFAWTPIQDTLRSLDATTKLFSPIKDNNVTTYGVNTFQIIPEVQWEIYPSEEYGLTFTQQFNNLHLLNDKFKQIDESGRYIRFIKSNPPDLTSYKSKRWIGTSEILGFYKPSANNQIFLRYRFNWDLENGKNNFNQIQIGLTTYLTSTTDNKIK